MKRKKRLTIEELSQYVKTSDLEIIRKERKRRKSRNRKHPNTNNNRYLKFSLFFFEFPKIVRKKWFNQQLKKLEDFR